jgi:hypothetical protein
MSKKEDKSTIKISLGAKSVLYGTYLFRGIKEWWERSYINKILAIAILVIAVMSAFLTFCDFFERFGLNWCPEPIPEPSKTEETVEDVEETKIIESLRKTEETVEDVEDVEKTKIKIIEPPPYSPSIAKIARDFFDNNSTHLQVKIEPTPPLNVGQEIFLHFTNNSDSNGYFLAFTIDSEGKLFSFVSEINKRLEPPDILKYLKIDKGQTRTIPQPNVLLPEDEPLVGLRVDETVGQALLVVILVDELPFELLNVLLPEPEISTSEFLSNLHEKLIKPVADRVGGTRRLQWYSLVIEHEIVSSTTKED